MHSVSYTVHNWCSAPPQEPTTTTATTTHTLRATPAPNLVWPDVLEGSLSTQKSICLLCLQVIESVESGALKRVFVIGGCDGAEHKRNYFSTLADILPEDTLILTMGCAKYRFNRHEFGMLGDSGIPRLLDMGQCNDSYGAVKVAQALAEAFNTDVNSLPLSITLSWFEQKAVAVLLSVLHLGIKNVRVGPVLPAFLTPRLLEILVSEFNLQPVDIRHPKDDLKLMMGQ